jgi:hypothetical protein
MVTQADITSGMETSPKIGSATSAVKTVPIKLMKHTSGRLVPSKEDEVRY